MNNVALEALYNGKSSANYISVVEARSACQVVQEENQGQKERSIAVPLSINVLNNINSIDNFGAGKARRYGMGHPGLLFQVSNGSSVGKTRSSSLPGNLESEKCIDNSCSDRSKSTSDEKLAVASNCGKINGDTHCRIKNEIVSNDSWFRTWPERGPDKFIYRTGKSSNNLTSDCRLIGVSDDQKQLWYENITPENGAEFSERNIGSKLPNLRKGKNTCVRSFESSAQYSLSPSRVDCCEHPENLDVNPQASNCKCISTPISLSKLLESMPSLAYNPVTKGLQLAVTEREAKEEEDDIPRCKPAIQDEEDDDLCERVAPPWGHHHPGCLRNGRLESIEEEEEEDRRKSVRQRAVEDPPDLFPSLPPRPLPSTSSSSASLSSMSSLSTGTGGCTTDEGCHGEGSFCGPSHLSAGKVGENRRSGISGFFSRNLFAWKLSKDGYQASNGNSICEGSAPGWKLFGKVPPRQAPAARDPAVIAEEFQQARSGYSESVQKMANGYHKSKYSNMQKLEAVLVNGCILPNGLDWGGRNVCLTNSTTALILENRPANLPAKSAEEEERHRLEYQMMLDAARKKELKEAKKRKKQLQQQLKMEEQLANSARIWSSEILPKWELMKNSRKTKDLWWQGIPPCVRGRVWRLSISNDLNITPELYEICVSRAQERLRAAENGNVGCNGIGTDGEAASLSLEGGVNSGGEVDEEGENPDKESSVELIQLDISRTFPHLCIFQEGGPYYDILHSLIGAYVCYRPDVGYVQGMSFLAAVLILNMDAPDAFICFANLLNRPCHIAFFRLKEAVMEAYYATYKDFFRENLPRLCHHFEQQGLSPDLYLLEWLYTVFSKAMPLDIACRVWDVFLRDGEEFLFRTALGVLHLNQDLLLSLDFIRGAQFLTRLPEDLSADALFRSIEAIRMSMGKMRFSDVLAQHMERCKREHAQPAIPRSTRPQTPS